MAVKDYVEKVMEANEEKRLQQINALKLAGLMTWGEQIEEYHIRRRQILRSLNK